VQHVDPEQLTLLALGEPQDASVADHLRQCPACRAEVDGLRRTATLAREGVDHRDAPEPPADMWDRIAAEAGIGSVPHGRHAAPPDPALSARVRRRWVRPVAALVAAVAVGVAGTVAVLRPWESGPGTVAASAATLDPVAGGPRDVSGRAVVVQGTDGPQLDVTARGLPLQSGYYEVWVFDGGRNMVSVGVLGADSTAALPLPPTLDLRTYHIVDISAEPYDGDQTHSKDSVLRGTLTN
jgi:anti-sigma-K factor RskA